MNANDLKTLLNQSRFLRQRAQEIQDPLFWSDFVNTTALICNATHTHIIKFYPDDISQLMYESCSVFNSQGLKTPLLSDEFIQEPWLMGFYKRALQNGFAIHRHESVLKQEVFWLGVKLQASDQETSAPRVLLLELPKALLEKVEDILLRAQLLADTPTAFGHHAKDESFEEQNKTLLLLLEVFVDIYKLHKFDKAAYALVNGIVSQAEEVDQVVFGWKKGEYVKVEAISHLESFEKKTDTVRLYEAALEEAVDQESGFFEANSKEADTSFRIDLARQQLKTHLNCQDVSSVVLYTPEGVAEGALLLIRFNHLIPVETLHSVTFIVNAISPKLVQLHEKRGNLFLKVKKATTEFFAFMFGKEWLWTKFFSTLLLIVVLWMLYGSLSFRIEAKAQFETDETLLVSAPYDGFIDKVLVTSGNLVSKDQNLIQLKTEDMLLQMSELAADLQRYKAEENKASASFKLVDAEIAKARQAQVLAKTARVELMLAQSSLKAPFDGVVVEGERKELLGSPAQKGQALFKLAKIEGIYITMDVGERDIHWVQEGDQGEFALISQPLLKMPFTVEKIIPMAVVADPSGAVFKVKAKLSVTAEDWWRPGMTGVAKIDKGEAAPYWILGRKIYHRLRIWLWW